MRAAKSARWGILVVLIACAAFFAGIFVHVVDSRQDHNIDRLISRASAFARVHFGRALPSPIEARSTRTFESALLPLVQTTLPISPGLGITPGRGGIAIVDDVIFVVDAAGSFLRVSARGKDIARLPIPPLPNRLEDYRQFVSSRLDRIRDLLVHDLESRKETSGIRLFVSYERFLPSLDATALAVSSILVDPGTSLPLGPWQDVYQGSPVTAVNYHPVAAGGRMVASGDTLYLTAGDYNLDNIFNVSALEAQNPASDFGKILSIDLITRKKTLLSMGHRNPQGLVLTSKGELYASEHGPKGADLLTRITPGANFGWPIRTLGTHYLSYEWPNRGADSPERTFDQPAYAWFPSIAPSNLIEITNFHPAWNHDLVVTSLRGRSLYRLREDEHGRVIYSEPIWIGERLRDIAALSDGTLVMWTDEAHLIFLAVDGDKLATNKRDQEQVLNPNLAVCEKCHHVGPSNGSHAAPTLSRVVGRKIASDNFDHYSQALSHVQGDWSEANLISFLTDPAAFAPGTTMAYRVGSKEQARTIVELLKTLE